MIVHIGILTSSDAHKALRAVRSAMNQTIPVTCSVIVNSTKGYYFDEVNSLVASEYPEVAVVETESNGKPGKGKNSAFRWMEDNVNADYYMLIDGDDFLYPVAVETLLPLMDEEYDLITGQAQDHWLDGQLNASWHDHQQNNAVEMNRDIVTGRDYDLWHTFSIDRIYAVSKRMLMSMPRMPEHLDLYEDFIFTCLATQLHQLGAIRYITCNSSYIYAYDATGDSQCSIFQKDHKLAQWNMDEFWRLVSDMAPLYFSKVPFIKLSVPDGYGLVDKYKCYKEVDAHEAYSRT